MIPTGTTVGATEMEFTPMKLFAIVIASALSFTSIAASAHTGSTDLRGCHRNHQTGEYTSIELAFHLVRLAPHL